MLSVRADFGEVAGAHALGLGQESAREWDADIELRAEGQPEPRRHVCIDDILGNVIDADRTDVDGVEDGVAKYVDPWVGDMGLVRGRLDLQRPGRQEYAAGFHQQLVCGAL